MTTPKAIGVALFPVGNALFAQATFQPDPISALLNLGAAGIMATMLWILLREQGKQFREDMKVERDASRLSLDVVGKTFKDALDEVQSQHRQALESMLKELNAERIDRQRYHESHLMAIREVHESITDLSTRVPPLYPQTGPRSTKKETHP